MESLLNFMATYQKWIYSILIITGILYLKRLISAWREWRATIFGLERDAAQSKLNSSLVMVFLILLLLAAEFITLTFIVSEWPQVKISSATVPTVGPDMGILSPASSDMQINSKVEIAAQGENGLSGENQSLLTPTPFLGNQTFSGCIPGQIEWIAPKSGEEISGLYELKATVNYQDMGFYKYQYSLLNDQKSWTAISAGNLPVLEGQLGVLATTEIANGDYVLRLIIVDKNNVESSPCDVAVRIMNKE
jgi:hypothetical protein